MSENPYQAPPDYGEAIGVKSGNRKDLRSVAMYQKGLLFSILAYLTAILAMPLLASLPILSIVIVFLGIIGILAGLVCVALLAIKVYQPAIGILVVIFMFVPLINMLILLSVNGKATRILKANGIRVGFMGAKMSNIE